MVDRELKEEQQKEELGYEQDIEMPLTREPNNLEGLQRWPFYLICQNV